MKKILAFSLVLLLILTSLVLTACDDLGSKSEPGSQARDGHDFVAGNSSKLIRIVAGSENRELEPILTKFAEKEGIKIQMDYMGSLDIMNMLRTGEVPYDALWPASSMWLTLGDDERILKHNQSISNMPVVFGIRESKAKELGLDKDDISILDISKAIKDKKLSFAMTSATQSNSGASSYLAFLTAVSGREDVLQEEDIYNEEIQDKIRSILGGVNRSSGSSNWLVDLFLQSDYDAMVNYEALIIATNEKLKEQGKETLTLVYPYDAISLADSPLAFVGGDGREEEEANFLKLQEYLLSDEIQKEIVRTGRRDAFGNIPADEKGVFTRWNINTELLLSPIDMPRKEVVELALNLYQTNFKKPSYTIYVLDYSGSMSGEGNRQMLAGLEQLMIAENAKQHLLQGSEKDISRFIGFNTEVFFELEAKGSGEELEQAYSSIVNERSAGGTDMYLGLVRALEILKEDEAILADMQPAIVLLSDGESLRKNKDLFASEYEKAGLDIPVFSIMYGQANESQLKDLADLTRARVFDGRKDLVAAFKSVKGYN